MSHSPGRQTAASSQAARRWAEELAAWAVPAEILDAAPRRPHVFSPEMFTAPPPGGPLSRSSSIAAEALDDGGAVLDVGCGGGAAAFAVAPPATSLFGTDRQPDMLALFERTAAERGLPARTVLGSWPEIAEQVPTADVVVCHHVLYNAADIVSFATALHDHAARRVVLEITERHPQVTRAPLWRHFWNLDRPSGRPRSSRPRRCRQPASRCTSSRPLRRNVTTSAPPGPRQRSGAASCACRHNVSPRSRHCCRGCPSPPTG